MNTERVPRHKWTPDGCPSVYMHSNGAWEHIGTRKVPGQIWRPKWCLGTHGYPDIFRHCLDTQAQWRPDNMAPEGHRSGVQAHIDTAMVLGNI